MGLRGPYHPGRDARDRPFVSFAVQQLASATAQIHRLGGQLPLRCVCDEWSKSISQLEFFAAQKGGSLPGLGGGAALAVG